MTRLSVKGQRPSLLLLMGGMLVLLASLACSLIGLVSRVDTERLRRPTSLPTLTPTTRAAITTISTAGEIGNPPPPLPTTGIEDPAGPESAGEVATSLSAPTPLIGEVSMAPATSSAGLPSPTFTTLEANATDSTTTADNTPTLTPLVPLEVRQGPGKAYPVVGQLVSGQRTQLRGQNPEGSWWQIVYPPGSGGLAWVVIDSQAATVSNAAEVPVAQVPALPVAPATATPVSAPAATATPITAPAATDLPTSDPITNPTPIPTATDTPTPIPTIPPTQAPEPTNTPIVPPPPRPTLPVPAGIRPSVD